MTVARAALNFSNGVAAFVMQHTIALSSMGVYRDPLRRFSTLAPKSLHGKD